MAHSEQQDLYALIIGQLLHDGHMSAASAVAEASFTSLCTAATNRLGKLVKMGALVESQSPEQLEKLEKGSQVELGRTGAELARTEASLLQRSVDLATKRHAPVYLPYTVQYKDSHKGPCRCAAFTRDGRYVATASADTIKMMDVSSLFSADMEAGDHLRSAVRTFQDTGPFNEANFISEVAFSPLAPLLASASSDGSVKLFDYEKPGTRAPVKKLQDTFPVHSLAFHPSGHYLATGTGSPLLRLYDLQTANVHVSSQRAHHHFGAINQVRWSSDGALMVSCSADGCIKLWDGREQRCVRTITNAHSGMDVSSVQFSRNGRYLLSSGLDSIVRLWDVGSGAQAVQYEGAHQQARRLQACLSADEDWVVSADEQNRGQIVVWDTRSGEVQQRLHTQAGDKQAGVVSYIVPSPVDTALVTCSDDHHYALWLPSRKSLMLGE